MEGYALKSQKVKNVCDSLETVPKHQKPLDILRDKWHNRYISKKQELSIMKLYQKIARVASQKNAILKWQEFDKLQKLLPIGNGIEAKSVILLKSTEKRIVIDTAYWHPNVSYETSRWTDHQIVITPSFEGEINIRVTGKNLNNIKEYLNEVFREALMKEYEVFKKGWEIKDSSESESN